MADGSNSVSSAIAGFPALGLATKDAKFVCALWLIPLHRPERWMERPESQHAESPDYWKKDHETRTAGIIIIDGWDILRDRRAIDCPCCHALLLRAFVNAIRKHCLRLQATRGVCPPG